MPVTAEPVVATQLFVEPDCNVTVEPLPTEYALFPLPEIDTIELLPTAAMSAAPEIVTLLFAPAEMILAVPAAVRYE